MDVFIGWAIVGGLALAIARQGDVLEGFFEMIDLSDNLGRVRAWVPKYSGAPAGVMALVFAGLSYGCFELAWRFDLIPTWEYFKVIASYLSPNDPSRAALVGVIITLMPTAIELFAVGLGRDGIQMVNWLVYAFVAIDLVTDYPAAASLVQGWAAAGLFDNWWGWATIAGKLILTFLWTLMASFGFEMLCVVFAFGAILLAFRAADGQEVQHGGGGGGRGRR